MLQTLTQPMWYRQGDGVCNFQCRAMTMEKRLTALVVGMGDEGGRFTMRKQLLILLNGCHYDVAPMLTSNSLYMEQKKCCIIYILGVWIHLHAG